MKFRDFEWDLQSDHQLFKIQTNISHFVKKHVKLRQKHDDFEWSGFQMVGIIGVA